MSALSHNLALGNLPFPALMQAAAAGGQGIPGLTFPMQPSLGLAGLSNIIGQRMSRPGGQEPPEILLDGPSESDRYHGNGPRESRKRVRSVGESDDDIMVLSNSPSSSNDLGAQREGNKAQSSVWENPGAGLPVGLGFPLPNPAVYPTDPSSAFMAAMGSQMPFDVKS